MPGIFFGHPVLYKNGVGQAFPGQIVLYEKEVCGEECEGWAEGTVENTLLCLSLVEDIVLLLLFLAKCLEHNMNECR